MHTKPNHIYYLPLHVFSQIFSHHLHLTHLVDIVYHPMANMLFKTSEINPNRLLILSSKYKKQNSTSALVSWYAAKSWLYFICNSDSSACSFSYSDKDGPPNFCWTNLSHRNWSHTQVEDWATMHNEISRREPRTVNEIKSSHLYDYISSSDMQEWTNN